jgi:hypothetical protein
MLVVICLYEHHSAARKRFVNFLRNVSEVGTYCAILVVIGMYAIAAALYSIMRCIEAADLTSAAAYGLSRDIDDMGAYCYLIAVAKAL